MKQVLGFILITLLFVSCQIEGTITSIDGSPVQGVTVTLSGGDTAPAVTTTDKDGKYVFKVSDGTYEITPEKSKYLFNPESQSVTYSGSKVTGIDFEAEPFDCTRGAWEGDYIAREHGEKVSDLAGYTSIKGDLVIESTSLTDLSELECLDSVEGYVDIQWNSQLTSLKGLNNLKSANGMALYVAPSLTSLQDLSNLSSVSSLFLYRIGAANLEGLENITTLNEGLYVILCEALTSLEGLNNLTSGGSVVGILENNSLRSIEALSNLTSVDGEGLYVNANPALTSLEGLNNLTTVGGTLEIIENEALISIESLYNVSSVSKDLTVTGNVSLCQDQAQSLVDQIGQENIGGTIRIVDNKECMTP